MSTSRILKTMGGGRSTLPRDEIDPGRTTRGQSGPDVPATRNAGMSRGNRGITDWAGGPARPRHDTGVRVRGGASTNGARILGPDRAGEDSSDDAVLSVLPGGRPMESIGKGPATGRSRSLVGMLALAMAAGLIAGVASWAW